MQRIEVAVRGVTITEISDPVISMYGTEIRPGIVNVHELVWEGISGIAISVSAMELPTLSLRDVALVVDLTWGEYFEVDEDAEGFADAVAELSRLSGVPVPELATVTALNLKLWPPAGD